MTVYTKCSNNLLFSVETNQFIDYNKRVDSSQINVPFFLWNMAGKGHHGAERLDQSDNKYSKLVQTDTVWLNNLVVTYIVGYKGASINFVDKLRGEQVTLSLGVRLVSRPGVYEGPYPKDAEFNVNYLMTANGRTQAFSTSPDSEFKYIPTLGRHSANDSAGKHFCYGVAKAPYAIIFHGQPLDFSYRALLSGPWAILLNDGGSFNSLVLLRGARPGALRVDRFVYSADPYILQVMEKFKRGGKREKVSASR